MGSPTARSRWELVSVALGLVVIVGVVSYFASLSERDDQAMPTATQTVAEVAPQTTDPFRHEKQGGGPPGVPDKVPAQPPDFFVHLTAPDEFKSMLRCSIVTRRLPTDDGSVPAHDNDVETQSDVPGIVPIVVPVGGTLLRISGPGIVPMAALVQRESGDACRLVSRNVLLSGGLRGLSTRPYESTNFVSNPDSHPTLILTQEEPLHMGDILHVELYPLIRVDVELADADGVTFFAPQARWSASWRLPAAKGFSGVYRPEDQVGATQSGVVSWYVPIGAEASARVELLGVELHPSVHRRTIHLSSTRETLRFTVRASRLGRLQVSSSDGTPLGSAEIARCLVVREAGDKKHQEGLFLLLLPTDDRVIDVWAPGHLMATVPTSGIPTDGTHLEVVLRSGGPAMVVRVEVEGGERDSELPIWIDARMHFVLPDRQPNWRWMIELPPSGEVTVWGDPPRVPAAKPRSDGYEFELVEKSVVDGLPFRRYVARKLTGIRVRLVNGGALAWPGSALVMFSRAVQREIEVGVESSAVADGRFFNLNVGSEQFIPTGRGLWVVRAKSGGKQSLYGDVSVRVTDQIVDVEIEPTMKYEWREFRIQDLTGHCRGKGTAFAAGTATLAGLREAQESAQTYAQKLVESDSAVPQVTLAPTACVAAHADGVVRLPTWFTGPVLVLPSSGRGFYEGHVNADGPVITVRELGQGATVVFAHDAQADLEQIKKLEAPGWFIAIREYSSLRDLTRVDGEDYKISSVAGGAELRSLPSGSYVAYYVRARTESIQHRSTGQMEQTVRLEWFDAVKFDVGEGAVHVTLPVTRQ